MLKQTGRRIERDQFERIEAALRKAAKDLGFDSKR